VSIWDIRPLGARNVLRGHSGPANCVAFSPNGPLASCGDDGSVRLFDPVVGNELWCQHPNAGPIESVAFSPDGRVLASGGRDGIIRLWDVASAELAGTIRATAKYVVSVAFSPDGKLLAACCRDATIRVWTSGSWREICTLAGRIGLAQSVAFLRDSRYVVAIWPDKSEQIWDLATGTATSLRPESQGERPGLPWRLQRIALTDRAGVVRLVGVSPAGDLIASDGVIPIWDAPSSDEPGRAGSRAYAPAIAISRDSRLIASASPDGVVRLWGVPEEPG
jgi:WD40 repeat protein